ncbi:MAG: hypothetical protein GX986_07990 [Firmicutes bacterium]|nr:hypothetical protein [Bacillota bacterium]
MAKTGMVTVRGKQYKLQHPGVRWYMENSDACRGPNGALQTAPYTQSLLDHVVTDPVGLKLDDFDSIQEVEELVRQIESFLRP